MREAIAYGRPRTRRPWRKILAMVEGIYSMEGEICDLKNISKVAKKYKAYLSVWKSISVSGAPDNSSLSHFAATMRPCWLRRAVRNAPTPSSRRRVDGVEADAAIRDERAVNLISTQVFVFRRGASIGALGDTGKGCCEHCGVDPADVDILMGTFTKSLGGMGGYVASSKAVVDHLRRTCPRLGARQMSPIMCAQVLRALDIVQGTVKGSLGREKIDALKSNSNYFGPNCKLSGCTCTGTGTRRSCPFTL